tara:strand:+ start:130 stop:765 length:636 start_codon:yes stop_codon:yes gene_type:complete
MGSMTKLLMERQGELAARQQEKAAAAAAQQERNTSAQNKAATDFSREFGGASGVGKGDGGSKLITTPVYKMTSGGKKKKWKGKKSKQADVKTRDGQTYRYDFERQGGALGRRKSDYMSDFQPNRNFQPGETQRGLTGNSSDTPMNSMSGDINARSNLSDQVSVGMTGPSSETSVNQNLTSAAKSTDMGSSKALDTDKLRRSAMMLARSTLM